MGGHHHHSSSKKHRSKTDTPQSSKSIDYARTSQSTSQPATLDDRDEYQYDSQGDYRNARASGSEKYHQQSGSDVVPGYQSMNQPSTFDDTAGYQNNIQYNYQQQATTGEHGSSYVVYDQQGSYMEYPGLGSKTQTDSPNQPGNHSVTAPLQELARSYDDVRIFIMYWNEEGVSAARTEARNIQQVFSIANGVRRIEVDLFKIPVYETPDAAFTIQRLSAFLAAADENDRVLTVVYYVGHGGATPEGSLELGRQKEFTAPTWMQWIPIADVLQQDPHDVVALLNCCAGGNAERPTDAVIPPGTLGKTMDLLTVTGRTGIAIANLGRSFGDVVQQVIMDYRGRNQAFSGLQLVQDIQWKAFHDGYEVLEAHQGVMDLVAQPMMPRYFQTISEG